jgi:hypothetical protein
VKPLHILPLFLAVSIPSAAWGQDLTCKYHDPWAEFHKHNMRRSNLSFAKTRSAKPY